MGSIRLKRIYEPPAPGDGARFLVDRLWPRGVKKEKAKLTAWLKDIAPSDALRKWFGHEPERWPEFQKRYSKELSRMKDSLKPLRDAARKGNVTLLFGAKDEERNNAVVLRDYLGTRTRKGITNPRGGRKG